MTIFGTDSEVALESTRIVAIRHANHWSVPPGWRTRVWRDEIAAIASLAILEAKSRFNPGRGVSIEAFAYIRAVGAIRTRHRREWAYGSHRKGFTDCDLAQVDPMDRPPIDTDSDPVLQAALDGLAPPDQAIVVGLFWEGRTESSLGRDLDLTQQAISKRKSRILRELALRLRQIWTDFHE